MKKKRRAGEKVNIFGVSHSGHFTVSSLGHLEYSLLQSSPTSRQKCLIFYHQDFVALVYDLLLAQSTNTIYGALAMCLEWYWDLRLDSKKTQAHCVLDVRQIGR